MGSNPIARSALGRGVSHKVPRPFCRQNGSAGEPSLELWLDGERLGRGPERGSERAWFYESYDLALTPGDHVLAARVWRLGSLAPLAQVSLAPGFLLAAEAPFAELLATGVAPWEVKRLDGYRFAPPDLARHPTYYVVAPNQVTDAARFPWGVELGEGAGWSPVVPRVEDSGAFVGVLGPHPLVPAMLPPQLALPRSGGTVRSVAAGEWDDPQLVFVAPGASSDGDVASWQRLVDGGAAVTIPSHTRRQIVLDLGVYTCAYPELVTSGGEGSAVTVCWAEALFQEPEGRTKGQRDQEVDVVEILHLGFIHARILPHQLQGRASRAYAAAKADKCSVATGAALFAQASRYSSAEALIAHRSR